MPQAPSFSMKIYDIRKIYVYILYEEKLTLHRLYQKIKTREPPLIDIQAMDIVSIHINAYLNTTENLGRRCILYQIII